MNRSKPASPSSAGRAARVPPATTMDAAMRRALSLADRPPAKQAAPARAAGKSAPSKSEVRKRVSQTVALHAHLLGEDIVRFRPKGGGDRRIKVEYLADPQHPGSILVRLTPASQLALPPAAAVAEDLLSTQEAADLLGVSRPYVVKLVEEGRFTGVVLTASGHRRIPRADVDRVHAEMRAARRAALDEMYRLSGDQRTKELEDALKHAKRQWVKKSR